MFTNASVMVAFCVVGLSSTGTVSGRLMNPIGATVSWPVYCPSASPVTRGYDQYGQQVQPGASPLYLIAFNDHTIRAAISYRVEGNTLHYVTTDREDKQAPLDTVDRALSTQSNRERRVPFQLP